MRLDRALAHLERYPFHMPGHKRNPDFGLPGAEIDITEIDGYDDLHAPTGVLARLQADLAALYGAGASFLSVNGSTCCILATISALCKPGDAILIARNCHKAVYNACFLNRLQVHYVEAEFDPTTSFYTRVTQAALDEALAAHPEVAAVVVTSPTYEGYISRLHCSVPLVVDAAHGAHLGLAPWLPGRMEGDAVICSYHKTLPALTQTAGVQVYDSSLAPKIKRYMDMYETSSPSYVLMNSVAKMADLVADPAAFETLQAGLQKLYKLPLQRLRLIRADDPTKINISTLHCNIDGNALAHRLRACGIEPEMSDRIHVICMATVGDTAAGFHLLARTLTEIDRTLSPGDWPVAPLPLPPRHLQSWQVPAGEPLPYQQAVGRIACETVFAYPPGVPMIVPGEEITAAFVQAIQAAKNSGTVLHGTAGGGAERICCCVLTKD